MKNPLIVIAGPTASGKTKLSVELAKSINGAIISADSMQVYKGMDIGTAKITEQEKQNIPHYLIDEFTPFEDFNIQVFQKRAKEAINEILENKQIPILVGGTGFYIQSVIYDIDFEEGAVDHPYRTELSNFANNHGNEALHERLINIDPISYQLIHPNNVKRVIRAIEYFETTGIPISTHNEQERSKETSYNLLFYVLNMDRKKLYQRIETRVDQMFEQGLVEEVSRLKSEGCTQDLISMQGLGYKEIFEYLKGETDLRQTKDILKRDTRHFAKRQLTWFKRENDVKWLDLETYEFDIEKIINKIMKDIDEFQIIV